MTLNAEQQARRDAIVALWNQGLEARDILRELGASYDLCSRNAVIGIISRARKFDPTIRSRPTTSPPGPPKPRRLRTKPSRTLASTGFVHNGTLPSSNASASPVPVRKPPRMDTHAPDESARCSILDLHFNTRCKWIVGDPRTPFEAIYCGSKTFGDGGPYCGHHARRADARMQIKDAA